MLCQDQIDAFSCDEPRRSVSEAGDGHAKPAAATALIEAGAQVQITLLRGMCRHLPAPRR